MATIPEITDRLEAATEKAENASQIIYDVANGDASTEVPTASGPTPTLKKWFQDLGGSVEPMLAGIPARLDKAMLGYETRAIAVEASESLPDGQYFIIRNDESNNGRSTVNYTSLGAIVFYLFLEDFTSVVQLGAIANGVFDNNAVFSNASLIDALKIIPAAQTRYSQSSVLARPSFGAYLPDPSILWSRITDSGKFNWSRDFYTDKGGTLNPLGASVWRFADRVLMGGAATQWAGNSGAADSGTSWLADSTKYPTYIGINSQALMIAHTGKIAYGAAVRTSDNMSTHLLGIGYGSAVINDKLGGQAWGGIHELQHEPGASFTTGWEIVCKNKSAQNPVLNPYYRSLSLASGGIYGLWLVAGGDASFGGDAVNPANTAIALVKNYSAGVNGCFNNGIVFAEESLQGTDGSSVSTGVGRAVVMARRHAVLWECPDGTGRGARLMSSVTTASKQVAIDFSDDSVSLTGSSSSTMLRLSHVANGVNFMDGFDAVAGSHPKIKAAGTDANIDMVIEGKGSGGAQMRDGAGIPKVRVNTTGVGFFNATPVARQIVGNAATDAATTQTLANNLRTALINLGLAQT